MTKRIMLVSILKPLTVLRENAELVREKRNHPEKVIGWTIDPASKTVRKGYLSRQNPFSEILHEGTFSFSDRQFRLLKEITEKNSNKIFESIPSVDGGKIQFEPTPAICVCGNITLSDLKKSLLTSIN